MTLRTRLYQALIIKRLQRFFLKRSRLTQISHVKKILISVLVIPSWHNMKAITQNVVYCIFLQLFRENYMPLSPCKHWASRGANVVMQVFLVFICGCGYSCRSNERFEGLRGVVSSGANSSTRVFREGSTARAMRMVTSHRQG